MMAQLSQVFRVLPRQVDETVTAALRQWMPGTSWSEVRALVRTRRVLVNGNLCVDAGRRLRLTDVVKVLPHPTAPPPVEKDVRIRHADAQVVVVQKPAGMTSTRHSEERHWPAPRKQLQPTLDELLPQILAKKERGKRRGKGVPPPVRAVHRLDRDTSGLMVFARTVSAERHLMQQFRKHATHRRYLAIAQGAVQAQRIETRLVRDRGDGRRGSTTLPDVGKTAVTHVRPLESLGQYTLVECRLETGRTHQIRVHLAERGHPLCGEKVYCQPLFGPAIADESGAPRLALHAAELGFEHPVTGEPMRFEMPLPEDLEDLLDRLRRDSSGAGEISPQRRRDRRGRGTRKRAEER
jgi:23S rRNA pseudouridine1911/1915/1917 synthase